MFCKRKWRVYFHYTDDSLGSDMNPRILNEDTSFFVKETTICTSVNIIEISAISILSIIALEIAISVQSLLSKIWVEECIGLTLLYFKLGGMPLFPQQRWWMHTNIQSRETIGQENHVTCLKLRLHLNFAPCFFGANSKTQIFYNYVIFKHSICFSQFPLQR